MTEPGDLRDLILHDQDFDLDAVAGTPDPVALAEALGLGKLVAVGFDGLPTWIESTATDWADVVANNKKWIQFGYCPDGMYLYLGQGDTAAGEDDTAFIYHRHDATGRESRVAGGAFGDDLADKVEFRVVASVDPDGTNPAFTLLATDAVTNATWSVVEDGGMVMAMSGDDLLFYLSCNIAGTGGADWQSNATRSQIHVAGNTGQTDPVLRVSSDSEDIFAIAPDGSVGGVTPNVGDVLSWDGTKIHWAAP